MREESTVLNFVYLNLGFVCYLDIVIWCLFLNSSLSGIGIEELYAGGRKGESTLQIRNPQSAIRN